VQITTKFYARKKITEEPTSDGVVKSGLSEAVAFKERYKE
jgi:hypothetical protein